MQNFSWKKLKGEFLCETYEYVGESTENIDNKIGSGRTADRAQRQGLENTPVRHLVPCCAEKIDCCPHITGFIKKKKTVLLASMVTTNGRRTTMKSGGNTKDITRQKNTEITKGRLRWKYRRGNEEDS